MKVKFFFAWYDLWIGFYYAHPGRLYICPLPCCVICLDWMIKIPGTYFALSFGESGDLTGERLHKAELRIGALYRKCFDMRSRIDKLEGDKKHE